MDTSVTTVIGLAMNVVGIFFLANSIIFRRPQRVLEEFFGAGKTSIRLIKDYVLNKILNPARRPTLIAKKQGGTPPRYVLDIHLQGDRETVFFQA